MRLRLGLLTIAAALLAPAAAPPSDKPGLNHVYVVLDQGTFDAIRSSAPLAVLLGPSDMGLPAYVPPGPDADRFFLRGRRTYLEFFAPINRFKEPVGKVGIGISADGPIGFRRVEAGWRRACGDNLAYETVAWTQVTPSVPWYDVLYCRTESENAELAFWAMIYRPEFGRWLNGKLQTDRRALLASRRGRFEVTGLTLDVANTIYPSLVSQLSPSGFRRLAVGKGVRLIGGGFALTVLPVVGRSRIRAIDIAASGSGARLRLGAADFVRLNPGKARLRFN